jgi:hypothetical protein
MINTELGGVVIEFGSDSYSANGQPLDSRRHCPFSPLDTNRRLSSWLPKYWNARDIATICTYRSNAFCQRTIGRFKFLDFDPYMSEAAPRKSSAVIIKRGLQVKEAEIAESRRQES